MVDDPYIEYSPTGYTIVDIIDFQTKQIQRLSQHISKMAYMYHQE